MTNDEKIRLVLETLGTDNVKQASRVLREMEEQLGKVATASTQAAGRSGPNGQGILQLAYFIDDLQYGMRGIMNNIPQVVQALGLGAGLAGVAGIAAVAVGTLVEKHPEWFEWSKKVKETLKELTDAIKAEEEAIKRQKEQVDKLGESTSKRIEDILKLKEATESLKEAEAQLAEDRKNAKATEEADKNVGAMATEELAKQKEVIKSVITDAGLQKQVRDELAKQVERSIPEIGGEQVDKESRRIAAERVPFFAKMEPGRQDKIAETFRGQAMAALQNKRGAAVQSEVESIFGGLMNPANQDELDRSMKGLDKFLPGVSRELRSVRQFDRENEAFDADNERWRRGGGAKRRAAEQKELQKYDEENAAFEAQNERWRQGGGARKRESERAAEIQKRKDDAYQKSRFAMIKNAIESPDRFRDQAIEGYNQAIEMGGNPMQVRALAERNRAAQMAEIAQGFEKAGMTREDAVSAAQQVMGKVTNLIENMIRTNQLSLDAFGRIHETVMNLEMQRQAQAAAWQQMGGQPQARPQHGRARQ